MKRVALILFLLSACFQINAQNSKTEFYDLIRKLMYDSTGYENVGDWAVGNPKKFPVKWKADKIEMSMDTSINFYRVGMADLLVNGRTIHEESRTARWEVVLKGSRMGYGSFTIMSAPSVDLSPKMNIDSLFGKRPFTAKLIKACDVKEQKGFYYYELKMPKKDKLYLKLAWANENGKTSLRIEGYDEYSRYAVRLACP